TPPAAAAPASSGDLARVRRADRDAAAGRARCRRRLVRHAGPPGLPDPLPAVLRRPPLWAIWQQPATPRPDRLAEAIGRLRDAAPTEPAVLVHGDFHPGNVIVRDGAPVGVVDWANCQATAAGMDIALGRVDLAIEPRRSPTS